MKKLPIRVVKGKPRNTVTRDITSKDKVVTYPTQPTKLKQTSIITSIGKGVKRKEETQTTPQWTMSKRAKNTNIKMVKW